MPGKVNPVIPEMVNQVAFWVIGNDFTVTMAAEAGQPAAQRVRAGHGARPAPGLLLDRRRLRRVA
ncbi:hypothetical protein [Nocardioides convexus]|uniref:hypothetical protein n=1 Tax=Nocardioides convexus TaxID=2712224 RepID=UPI0024187A88|nr:hypothetical protein [Nocardioides convexus]